LKPLVAANADASGHGTPGDRSPCSSPPVAQHSVASVPFVAGGRGKEFGIAVVGVDYVVVEVVEVVVADLVRRHLGVLSQWNKLL
jgi:hypothetical protein